MVIIMRHGWKSVLPSVRLQQVYTSTLTSVPLIETPFIIIIGDLGSNLFIKIHIYAE